MSGRLRYKVATFALAALLATIVGARARRAQANPQDEALMALGMLEVAKGQIVRAAKDDAGHRAKALQATQAAIKEVQDLAFERAPAPHAQR